jgi:cytochrome c-type biogenesis protein CcmH
MIGFWIAAAFLAAGAGSLILLRAARGSSLSGASDPAVAVYRRALIALDNGVERDLRAEAARRLLEASALAGGPESTGKGPLAPLLAAALVALAAMGLYLKIGSAGAHDQPFAARLAAWRANPERYGPAELAAALHAITVERPGDIEPLRRLAGLDLAMGDADGAAHALRKAVALAPERADLLAALGEVLVLKAHGDVNADARAVFQQAIRLDPASPTARFYLGRAEIAGGDRAGGLAAWRRLLAELPVNDPRRTQLAAEISAIEHPGAAPPPAGDTAAPAVSGAIAAMVEGLASRLRAHPDDPDGWVRLVRAYTVLGKSDKRDLALAEARRRYAGRPDILRALDAATKAPSPSPSASAA